MTLEKVIKTELEQQYEQYRWIGRQQTLVFTFYAAIVAATFALISAFSKDASAAFFSWFLVILLFLGIVGISISYALIHSREMQFRTALYLTELLIQITELSKPNDSPVPAIRFRQIPTSGGAFKPRDTAIIAISLAFVFGIGLILGSISLFITNRTCIDNSVIAIIWLIMLVLFSLLGIFCVLPKMLEKENIKARTDHSYSKNVTAWKDELRRSFQID